MTTFFSRLASFLSLARWSRIRPSGGVYLAEIDGLRFVAISAVMAVHITDIWVGNVGRTYPDMGWAEDWVYRTTRLGGFGVARSDDAATRYAAACHQCRVATGPVVASRFHVDLRIAPKRFRLLPVGRPRWRTKRHTERS